MFCIKLGPLTLQKATSKNKVNSHCYLPMFGMVFWLEFKILYETNTVSHHVDSNEWSKLLTKNDIDSSLNFAEGMMRSHNQHLLWFWLERRGRKHSYFKHETPYIKELTLTKWWKDLWKPLNTQDQWSQNSTTQFPLNMAFVVCLCRLKQFRYTDFTSKHSRSHGHTIPKL